MTAAVDRTRLMPYWPRLMSRDQAAAYLGMSANHFAEHIAVRPIRLGKRVLYDRLEIDRFIDTLSGRSGGRAEQCEW